MRIYLNQVKKTIEFIETQVREHTFLGQHAQFVTKRDYPEFVIQEMTVNACCHRAYNIKGTEIQIKMFDDRLFVKEFGEGFDRICREQEANGANVPSFRTDEFILKITVPKVAENVQKQTGNVTENGGRVAENHNKVAEKLTENHQKLIEKLIEKAAKQGDRLTENRKSILRLVIDDPYISKADLSKLVGSRSCVVSTSVVSVQIKAVSGR